MILVNCEENNKMAEQKIKYKKKDKKKKIQQTTRRNHSKTQNLYLMTETDNETTSVYVK